MLFINASSELGLSSRKKIDACSVSSHTHQIGEGMQCLPDWYIKAMVATKLGSNQGRDINGKDSDGGNSHLRGWLQLAKFF